MRISRRTATAGAASTGRPRSRWDSDCLQRRRRRAERGDDATLNQILTFPHGSTKPSNTIQYPGTGWGTGFKFFALSGNRFYAPAYMSSKLLRRRDAAGPVRLSQRTRAARAKNDQQHRTVRVRDGGEPGKVMAGLQNAGRAGSGRSEIWAATRRPPSGNL